MDPGPHLYQGINQSLIKMLLLTIHFANILYQQLSRASISRADWTCLEPGAEIDRIWIPIRTTQKP